MGHHQGSAEGIGKAPGQLFAPPVYGTEGPMGPDLFLQNLYIPDICVAQVAFKKGHDRNIIDSTYRGIQHGFRFIGMELESNDMPDSQAGEDLKVNPKAHRIAAGGSVRAGTGYKRLKNHYAPGLGTLNGIDSMVKFDLGFFYPYFRVIPGGTGKKNYIFSAHRPGDGYFHFAVGETVGIKDLYPVNSLRKRGAIRLFEKMPDYTGSVIPHGSGSGDNKFMHMVIILYFSGFV
jgi:hypothetical protein